MLKQCIENVDISVPRDTVAESVAQPGWALCQSLVKNSATKFFLSDCLLLGGGKKAYAFAFHRKKSKHFCKY